ncbi:hypothetical protein GCM10009552_23890 [Rothia nasimurium]|uniref:CBM-cenC domain-containing protein n=1 Tax=Luteibacter anthropi TaxID=564369 RepID=A0A7X5U9W1_9GAMM|nr:hypothetical protein [Luteibacter anthropi]NII06447.1 hypothetical protein [Luteibacter anthropi]
MDFSRVNFVPLQMGGDDVTGALRKLDLNFGALGDALVDQNAIDKRLGNVETIVAGLGQASVMNVGNRAGTVAAGDDTRFNMGAWRNKVINGNFDFWQGGLNVTAPGGPNTIIWGPDRFLGQAYTGSSGSGSSTVSLSAQAFPAGQTEVPGDPAYFARLQPVSLATLGGAGGIIRVGHYMENVATLNGRYVAVSFWAKSNASRTIAVALQQNFGSNGSTSVVKSTSLSISANWARYTVRFPVGGIVGKTIGDNSNLFLGIYLFNNDSTGGVVPVGSWTTGQYLDLSQIQVEEVDDPAAPATPFERRPMSVEEALVRRYTTTSKLYMIGRWGSATNVRFYNQYEVPMRRTPDCILQSTTFGCEMAQVAAYTMSNASIAQYSGDNRQCFIDFSGSPNGTPSGGAMAQMNSSGVVLFRAEF